MENRIRLVIADDNTLVRSSVRTFLSIAPRIQIVAEAASGDDAQAQCLRLHPDVLLLDVEMPGISTVAIIRAVHALTPPVKVLICTAYNDAPTITRLLETGIVGYILKDEALYALDQAIESIADGSTWFSPTIATMRTRQNRNTPPNPPPTV